MSFLLKASLAFLATVTLAALAAPWIAPYTYYDQNLADRLVGPGISHWMGTDVLGRDLFSRVLYGARMSLFVGALTAFFSLVIGTLLGAVAGFWGGPLDRLVLRLADVLSAIPAVLLAILVMIYFGRGLPGILGALALTTWIPQARLVRGQVLQARELPYVEAARALGVPPAAILYRHVLPSLIGPMIVLLSTLIPGAIMAESFLSFIGLGLQPPYSSWGTLANEGFRGMRSYPHLILFPGGTLFLVLLAFNSLGDGLRDWFAIPGRKRWNVKGAAAAMGALGLVFWGFAGTAAQADEKSSTVEIELTHLTRDEWQIEYKLSTYVSGLVFTEQDTTLRHETWKPSVPYTSWKTNGGREIALCEKASGCDRFQFKFRTRLQPFATEYEFFHAFRDGARIIFLRYLRMQPWLCEGAPNPGAEGRESCMQDIDTISESMNLYTKLNERIYANGVATDVKHFSVRGPRRYAYFGESRIIDQTWKDPVADSEPRITSWIVDERMPGWIQDLVPSHLPKVFGIFAAEVSKNFPVTTELMIGYEPANTNRLELRAGNIRGQVQATVAGQIWRKKSKEGLYRLVSVLVHELAHTWSSQLQVRTKSISSWVTEGGTDALAYAAAVKSGFVGRDDFRELWQNALNRCLVNLKSRIPLNDDPGADGTYHPLYSCGSLIWLVLAKEHNRKDPASGILELWNFLLLDLRKKDSVTEAEVVAAFRARGVSSRRLDWIAKMTAGAPGRRELLVRGLQDAGIRISALSGEPDADTRTDLGMILLSAVVPESCRSPRIFDTDLGLRLRPERDCPLFSALVSVRGAEGGNLIERTTQVYDKARTTCAKKGRLTLTGSRPVQVSCRKIEERPEFKRIVGL